MPEGYNTDNCSLGDPKSISPNCKLQPTGNLSAPICTGVKLKTWDEYCLNTGETNPGIRSINPIQNYYCDEDNKNKNFQYSKLKYTY